MSASRRVGLRPLRAVLVRELLALFATPVAWIVLALLSTLLAATFIVSTLRTGEPATLRAVLLVAGWGLFAAAPAIAMRSFSEEFRQGTWETLLAAPIRPWQAVAGKFLAGWALVAVLVVVPAVVLGLVLERYADPDWGELATGVGGLVLAGGTFLAIGILASTLTSNQLVAFLVPVFVLFALALGSRGLAASVPAAWAPAAFALDPLRRIEDFVLGLVDSANIVAFGSAIVGALALAAASLARVRSGGFGGGARGAAGRGLRRADAGLFALGVCAAVAAATALASEPRLRLQLDATKTRAYTLAPTTEELVRRLEGPWRIAVLVGEERADPGSLRRVDEVLRRMAALSPNLSVERIDPDAPTSAARYEELLESLVEAQRAAIDRWEPALESAFERYGRLRAFAREESGALRTVVLAIREDAEAAALREQLERVGAGLLQLADQGDAFESALREFLRTGPQRPLPDYDGARSGFVANERLWSDQFATIAALARDWERRGGLPEPVRAWAKVRGAGFETMAQELREGQFALEELPPLELGELGRTLAQGECALVLSPRGAAAIPSWQFAPASTETGGRGRLGFDFAARAEQLFTGAVRSLLVERMPLVVFVHAEERTLLAPTEDRNDLAAVADALRSARFQVREWSVAQGAAAERPTPARGQTAVWVIVPPLKREGLQTSERERRLVETTRALLREGQPTLVTFARNLLPIFGQRDPWSAVAADLGLEVSTGRVVLELVSMGPERFERQPWQTLQRASREHPIGAAIDGQATILNHPTPIAPLADADPAIRRSVVAVVEPSADRWIEDDWRTDARAIREVPQEKRFDAPLSVVVAVERRTQSGASARAVVVGSGGWLLSMLADVAQTLGGSRVLLSNPGNRELMLASAAWLGGVEAIGGAAGREVPRVGTIPDRERAWWFAALVGGGPLAIGAMGTLVWWRRRSDR